MNALLTKAPSTRVQIFLNRQLFKKIPRPHVAYSNRIRLFTRIRLYPDLLWRNSVYTLCRHIGLLLGKKLDTILLRRRIRKCPDSPVHTLSDRQFRLTHARVSRDLNWVQQQPKHVCSYWHLEKNKTQCRSFAVLEAAKTAPVVGRIFLFMDYR